VRLRRRIAPGPNDTPGSRSAARAQPGGRDLQRPRPHFYGLVFYPPGATEFVAALDVERYVPSASTRRSPGLTDALVMTMTRTALRLGDKLAEMADAIAQTIRVTTA
jgi:hypothetical protein